MSGCLVQVAEFTVSNSKLSVQWPMTQGTG